MAIAALYLWCLGLGLVTFDLVLAFELGGFTIKGYYFVFLASGLLTLARLGRAGKLWDPAKSLLRAPWLFAFALFLYELAFAPFSLMPKKSFAYSIWLFFDLTVVGILGSAAIRAVPRESSLRALRWTLIFTGIFLSLILIADHIAYSYGYIEGWIGYNQDRHLKWGVSRPHAFAYEPSYLAMYFSIALPFIFARLMGKTASGIERRAAAFCSALLILSLYLLYSRTGWVAAGLGMAALLVLRRDRIRQPAILLCLVAGITTVASVVIFSKTQHTQVMQKQLVKSVIEGTDGSTNSRLRAMKKAVVVFRDTKFLGTGVGASHARIMKSENIPGPYETGAETIMSIWGQLLAESGLFGVLCFLSLGVYLWRGLKVANLGGPTQTALLVSSAVFFVFTAHWVGNVARTDIWVWFAAWHAFARPASSA